MENKTEIENRQEESKIYDYLLTHPTVLISIISATVIIITFILNSVIYVKTYRELQSWGIDARYVQIDSSDQIYMLAGISVIFFINNIFLQIMLATYDKYLVNINSALVSEVLQKDLKKEIIKLKIVKMLTRKKLGEDEKKLLNFSNEILSKNKVVKKELISSSKRTVVSTTIIIGLFSAIMYCNMFILIIPGISLASAGFYSLIASVLYVIIIPLIKYLLERGRVRRKIKTKTLMEDISCGKISLHKECEDREYIMDKILDLKFREIFSDRGILDIFILLAVCISMFSLFLFSIYDSNAGNEKRLSIINENGQDYVIVHTNNEFYYLEEAKIDDEAITVYVSKQKLIKKEGVEYQVHTFDKDNIRKSHTVDRGR